MLEAISEPEHASETRSTAHQIELADLDDKHLTRYRHPRERWSFAVIALAFVGFLAVLSFVHPHLETILKYLPLPVARAFLEWLHPTRIGIIIVLGVLLMSVLDAIGQSTRAWQLVARAVEVTPATFPQLAPVVDELRVRFDLPRTRVYVSRDAPSSGYAVGIREPHAIVFSSIGVASLTPEEFKFVLGREMGHIKLGHTLAATVMGSAFMSLPSPLSYLLKVRKALFGSYQHAQELSSDRIGVVATRDVRPAFSATIKQNFGSVRGAKIDLKTLAPQTAALSRGVSGRVLRGSLMLHPQPFALARLAELAAWAGEPEEPVPAEKPAPSAAASPSLSSGPAPSAVDSAVPPATPELSPPSASGPAVPLPGQEALAARSVDIPPVALGTAAGAQAFVGAATQPVNSADPADPGAPGAAKVS